MNSSAHQAAYGELSVGEQVSFSVSVTEALVEEFSRISGDRSPLHMDAAFAKTTPLGGRVAHGMIVGALFSRLIGMHLPGKYSLYLSQTLHFHKPIALGAEIEVRGEIMHKTDAFKAVVIRTSATDARSKDLLVSGEATVQLLE
jgi:3-hydroxybutyryl-CoA dehydratase